MSHGDPFKWAGQETGFPRKRFLMELNVERLPILLHDELPRRNPVSA